MRVCICVLSSIAMVVAIGFCSIAIAGSSSIPPRYLAKQINGAIVKTVKPTAINNAGAVVGCADNHAFVWNYHPTLQSMSLLGTLPPTSWLDGEGISSEAEAISNNGQIVGGNGGFQSFVMSGLYACYAFIGNADDIHPLFTNQDRFTQNIDDNHVRIPHEERFEAFGINSLGTVVGLDGYRGFIYHSGIETDIKPISNYPEGNGTSCAAINDKGWFVGATTINKQIEVEGGETITHVKGKPIGRIEMVPNSIVHAFVCRGFYPKHRLVDLGSLKGLAYSTATALNNKGDVVGYTGTSGEDKLAEIQDDGHAFLWHKNRMTDLGVLPGEKSSRALGINNAGVVVGESGDHAVVWINGKIYDLNKLINSQDIVLTSAVGINTMGQIACVGKAPYDPNDFSGIEEKTGWLLNQTN